MNARENKALIWNLLQTHGHFNKIDQSQFATIQLDFEDVINHIDKNSNQESILELNKQAISTFIKHLEKYKITHHNNVHESKKATSSDIKQQKLDEFNQEYDKKKKEFDSFMTKKVPEQIDFNDVVDEPFKEDVGEMIDNMVSNRESQLQTILDSQPKPNTPEKKEKKHSNKQLKMLQQILDNQEKILKLFENKI